MTKGHILSLTLAGKRIDTTKRRALGTHHLLSSVIFVEVAGRQLSAGSVISVTIFANSEVLSLLASKLTKVGGRVSRTRGREESEGGSKGVGAF